MPANYAHYRFGKQLLSGMCPNDRRSIQRFRRLYDMGLHGPDIFFYYNPLIKTATGQLGGVFHAQSGQEFLARVCAQARAARPGGSIFWGCWGITVWTPCATPTWRKRTRTAAPAMWSWNRNSTGICWNPTASLSPTPTTAAPTCG